MVNRHLLFFIVFLFLLEVSSGAVWAARDKPLKFFKTAIYGIPLSIIQAPLSRVRVVPVISRGGVGTDESFDSMALRTNAFAAIDGCYFDKRTLRPIGDIASDGRLLSWGGFGAFWGMNDTGNTSFGYLPKWTHKNYSDYKVGISCIPYLVRDGRVTIRSQADLSRAGFHDRDVFHRTQRAAVAFTRSGSILLVASGRAYMSDFARALQALGVENAIGLDGGSSVGLYYRGKTLDYPTRRLTSILALVPRE